MVYLQTKNPNFGKSFEGFVMEIFVPIFLAIFSILWQFVYTLSAFCIFCDHFVHSSCFGAFVVP
jgi:hypothetical protein